MAARRRVFAARLADGCVRELRSLPPEIWFRGATVSHEVKCFSVAQRRISTPISDTSLSAPYGPRPGIAVRSTPAHSVYSGTRISKRGSLALRRRAGRGGQRQDQAIVEPLVLPFVVVVRDELADGATPRALADQDHALEAGFLDGAHEALRVSVQVRRAGGASDGGDIGRGERVAHGRPEERVARPHTRHTGRMPACLTGGAMVGDRGGRGEGA